VTASKMPKPAPGAKREGPELVVKGGSVQRRDSNGADDPAKKG
jgi:hypothetical protein